MNLRFVGLVVGLLLLVVPASAWAGGDDPAPHAPTTSPPGPWSEGRGDVAPYKPAGGRRCRVRGLGVAAPGALLGLYVQGVPCARGAALVEAYGRCLRAGPRPADGCYRRIRRRCVQPTFLGRCRVQDRFYYRSADGFRCVERRVGRIGDRFDANVSCSRGSRRIDHSYTLILQDAVAVGTEPDLRAAWANPRIRAITLTNDIVLWACRIGDPIRETPTPVVLDGAGHTLRQGCFEKRLLRQDGTGYVELRRVTLTRGGSDGPGGAVTTRGEITVIDSKVQQNLAEEPGGGIMSQRRATIIRSVITGNLANDDGGGVYARRGGIQVYDSIISANLVDGSGGALGSTGDILVVRSHLDGNTTDGDGGAIYTDEDGDVTVINSTVSGSAADGPGGAIFTLDGDVTIIGSSLIANRADDRGGAISGEADVTIVNSLIDRNLAVAHVGGGVWSRGNLYVANSTVTNNYAEAKGGGLHAAGVLTLVNSTVRDNVSGAAANIGVGERLDAFGSIIGPAKLQTGGQTQPTTINCDAPISSSLGWNVITDDSCGLRAASDRIGRTASAVDVMPAAACGTGPAPVLREGEQHLAGLVGDWNALLGADQRGVPRPQGAGCDAGAVER